MSGIASLPDDALKHIVHFLPVKDRLTGCCLVSKRLHAAALAATQEVKLGYWSLRGQTSSTTSHLYVKCHQRATSFLEWLSNYGQHLTSLEILRFPQPLNQLLCPNLQELVLGSGCKVWLGSAAHNHPGVLVGCTKLTQLQLSCDIIDQTINDEPDAEMHLQQSLLKDLHVQPGGCNMAALAKGLQPCMSQLTSLSVCSEFIDLLAQLGPLTKLQELFLPSSYRDSPAALGPNSMPGLVFPASLTKLSLKARVEAGILSLVPRGLKELCIDGEVVGPAEGPGSLLSGLGRLQHLTVLLVSTLDFDQDLDANPGTLDWPLPGPAYSAFTASSALVSLVLRYCKVPAGVWPFVFPAQHTLPHLTSFCIRDDEPGFPPTWGAADLSSLVSCCPNLCEVTVLSVELGLAVSELHKLTALTCLALLFGTVLECQEGMNGLAAMTQLRTLWIDVRAPDFKAVSLLPLTSLKALTSLSCWSEGLPCCSAGAETAVDDGHVFFQMQAAWDTPVWLQVLRRCAESDRQAAFYLSQQLAGAEGAAVEKAVTLDQQRQSSIHRQHIVLQAQQQTSLEDTVAEQGVLIDDLREELSAQQQVVTEQAAQIAGLQEQLHAVQSLLKQFLQL